MTLEIALRRPLVLPRFVQVGGGEPPKAHWINKPATQGQEQGTSNNNSNTPKKKNSRGYRDLSTITLGEVDDAYQFFAAQLVPSPYPSWIAPNCFCMIHLVEKDDQPSVVFGRVKNCYPSDGQIQNIREMELLFPREDGKPDTILLRAGDIRFVESYFVRVKFLATREEAVEFGESEGLFTQQGFVPEFEHGFIDFIESNKQDQLSLQWIYLISSRWFASIPESVKPEIGEKLRTIIHDSPLAFNYHPEYLHSEVRRLNRELGFQAGYTDYFLIEPKNHQQSVQIIAKTFGEIFDQGMR